MRDLIVLQMIAKSKAQPCIPKLDPPRNAKCPCGSGKKWKNCCLKKRRNDDTTTIKSS